jgi:hypothetical protein
MGKKEKQLCKWKGDDIDKEFKRLSDNAPGLPEKLKWRLTI